MNPPVILMQPKSAKVKVCSEVTFNCSASGYGKLTVTWKKLSDELPATRTISNSESGKAVTSYLKITDTVWYHRGTYYCTVKNSAGEVNSSIVRLNVTGNLLAVLYVNAIA